ncbi:hypothetical protein KL909_005240 [Ogataea angusta]|nr:hypothetical protein KL909_005240 [Ogataea angusta]
MKYSVLLGALALSLVSALAEDDDSNVVTTTVYGTTTNTHKYGRFDKTKASSEETSSGTHKYGRFDKTKASEESSSTGTHKYGRFDKTRASEESTSTGTHKYGRFDKTQASEESTSTGTHKYGRFDKTKASEESSSTGTHKYGRFDKTKARTTTTVYIAESSAAAEQRQQVLTGSNSTSNSTSSAVSSSSAGAAHAYGLSMGMVVLGAAARVQQLRVRHHELQVHAREQWLEVAEFLPQCGGVDGLAELRKKSRGHAPAKVDVRHRQDRAAGGFRTAQLDAHHGRLERDADAEAVQHLQAVSFRRSRVCLEQCEDADADRRKRRANEPVQLDVARLLDEQAGRNRAQHERNHRWQQRQSCVERRRVVEGLEVHHQKLRNHHERAVHTGQLHHRHGHAVRGDDLERQQRLLRKDEVPDAVQNEQHAANDKQADDGRRVPLELVVAERDGQQHEHEPAHHGDDARVVDLLRFLEQVAGRRLGPEAVHEQGHDHGGKTQVDVETPSPGGVGGEHTAEDRADDRRRDERDAHERHDHRLLVDRGHLGGYVHHARLDPGAADALDGPPANEHVHRRGHRTHERADLKQENRREHHPPSAKNNRHPAPDLGCAPDPENKGRRDPRQLLERAELLRHLDEDREADCLVERHQKHAQHDGTNAHPELGAVEVLVCALGAVAGVALEEFASLALEPFLTVLKLV